MEDTKPLLDVRLVTLPSVPLAIVRRQVRRTELSSAVREGCGFVWTFARERNLPAGRHVAVYLDASIRLEVGVEMAVPFTEENGVVRSATPAGLTACVTLLGPYDQLRAAHGGIHAWCAAQGHRLAGPNWEIYGHWQPEWNTDPSRVRTDIFYQVVAPLPSIGDAP